MALAGEMVAGTVAMAVDWALEKGVAPVEVARVAAAQVSVAAATA